MPAPARKPRLLVDTHVRVVAWLHIALSLALFALVCVLALGMAAFSQWGRSDEGVFKAVGGTVLLGLGIFPVIELIGAVKLLGGRPSGRIITMIFSVLYLLKFPVGTAIGVYSFWVLLRDPPKTARAALSAPAGEPASALAPPPAATDADLAAAIRARRSALAAARSRVAATAGAAGVGDVASTTGAPAVARPPSPLRPATPAAARPAVAAAPASTPPRRPDTPRPS
jgi:hypothetical protein